MNNEKFIEVSIKLKESTFQYIENIVEYENKKNRIINDHEKIVKYVTVEEFIVGCCMEIIKKLETYNENIVHGFDNTKKYKLKNKIKEMLKDKNIKQLDLAELTGVEKSTINLIVNNHTQPTLEVFLRIWYALGCPPIEEMFYKVPE